MENGNKLQRKTWQQPKLLLISQGNINGGVNNGFKEHSHNGGLYHIHPNSGGAPFTISKTLYDVYIHS